MANIVKVAIKVLRVMGPDVMELNSPTDRKIAEEEIERTVNTIDWSSIEDAANDNLPDGYYAKIDDV